MPTLHEPLDYQPRLIDEFKAWANRLHQLGAAGVEHIGASAIPGAISKGDLDILVLVAPSELEVFKAAIERSGFAEKAGTLRTPELCMMVHPDHNHLAIQVVARGSEFQHLFLAFRDALRADERLVREYNEIKLAAAGLQNEEYRAAKEQFIRAVLNADARWASVEAK